MSQKNQGVWSDIEAPRNDREATNLQQLPCLNKVGRSTTISNIEGKISWGLNPKQSNALPVNLSNYIFFWGL